MSSRIPLLLERYLALPARGSFTLLTGVLGATAHWLVALHLYSLLARPNGGVRVVLFSLMRSYAFWKAATAKLGLDLDIHKSSDRLVFLDGLCQTAGLEDRLLEVAEGTVHAAAGAPVVLVADQPDLLLHVMQGSSGCIHRLLVKTRQRLHAVVLAVSADEPLVGRCRTQLERRHAAFVIGLAHEADRVMAVRCLDSGGAADVSGVVRITRGGALNCEEQMKGEEYLYFIGNDGVARVFARGE